MEFRKLYITIINAWLIDARKRIIFDFPHSLLPEPILTYNCRCDCNHVRSKYHK